MTKSMLYGATKVDENNVAYAAVSSLEQFQWKSRVLVIFADEDNARAARQENMLMAERAGLDQRDMVVVAVRGDMVAFLFGAGQNLKAEAIRSELDGPGIGEFAAILIGKDGTVKLRAAEPVAAGELFAMVDAMPIRAAEATALR